MRMPLDWRTTRGPERAGRRLCSRCAAGRAAFCDEAGAILHVRRLTAGERTAVPDAAYLYVHVARGEVRLAGEELGPGDAARITGAADLEAVALTPAELLVWEMTG